MVQITQEQLFRSMRNLRNEKAGIYLPFFNAALAEFGIDTLQRVAYFIGQVAHESCDLKYFGEIWDGQGAQARYGNRADLGNTQPAAIEAARKRGIPIGKFYKGHGCIQTTGYSNHKRVGDALGIDAVNFPELLEKPEFAFRSAGLFWRDSKCNVFADAGDIRGLTKKINGGFNGLDDRIIKTAKAKKAIGISQ